MNQDDPNNPGGTGGTGGAPPGGSGNWWEQPEPAWHVGHGPWPPPLPTGAHYGPNPGDIVASGPGGFDLPPGTVGQPGQVYDPATGLWKTPIPTPPPTAPGNGNAPPAPSGLDYATVLAKAQAYYKQKWGVDAGPDVLASIKHDLGFQEGGRIQESALGGIQTWIDGHKPGSVTAPGPTAPPTGPGGPGGFGATPPPYNSDPNAPTFNPLQPYVPPTWTGGDYHNPTQAELEASPGYQTRLDAGLLARNRSAAARGTVLNGGTLKSLDRYSQDYAANEYQNLRANTYDEYKQKYSQFTDAAGMNLAARTVNANDANTTFQNRTSTYNQGNTRTLSDYLTNLTSKRNSELDYWNRLMDLQKTGAGLAGGSYK